MPTEPQPVTMAEVVHRAVEVCEDSTSNRTSLDELLERFEDDDEPIAVIEDVQERLDEAWARLTPMSAARAEFGGHPPEPAARWLADQGVTI